MKIHKMISDMVLGASQNLSAKYTEVTAFRSRLDIFSNKCLKTYTCFIP